MRRWWVAVGVCVGAACAAKEDSVGSGTSGSASTSSESGTGTPGLECEDLSTEAACLDMVSQNNLPCAWGTFRAVEREGDVCTDLPSVSFCVELSGWTTEAGCRTDQDCPSLTGNALHRQLADGTMLISTHCGGSVPVGFDSCETVLPDANPPECACACPTFPNYGETSGSGG